VFVRFGGFTLDEARRQLTRDGRNVHLTPKAFDLLALLASAAPRVISKAELHERIWAGTFVSDATLVGLVKEVRRALEDHDPDAPIIRTVHRVGYAFGREVEDRSSLSQPRVWHWLVLRGHRVPLGEGENVIGRDPSSQVCLEAAGVSRRHARILIGHAGAQLEDLGSKNGTMVGDAPIGEAVALRDGDRIEFGTVVGVYRASSTGMSTETRGRHVPGQHTGSGAGESRAREEKAP
jgi:DNA-binding winged helix-turn-helix (wHTH) protein